MSITPGVAQTPAQSVTSRFQFACPALLALLVLFTPGVTHAATTLSESDALILAVEQSTDPTPTPTPTPTASATASPMTQAASSILFIGNSFTYGAGSAAQTFHPEFVKDLNNQGIGGVPALFKAFTVQAELNYDVSLETEPGSGLDYHFANRLGVIDSRAWDKVVMHGHSLLDPDKPGDPAKLVASAKQMAGVLVARNPQVDIYLTATWSRADQTYPSTGRWANNPISKMALDVRAAYDTAAQNAPRIKAVNPVGEAWNRAMQTGIADPNPYDGIAAGKLNLWTDDHYHGSSYGYYLHALVVFGAVTGRDPRSLGAYECAAFELGMSQRDASALQQVAFDELTQRGLVTTAPFAGSATSVACSGSITKRAQTLTFANPGDQNFGTTPGLSASASSSLTPTFTSSTAGVCTVTAGGALTLVAAGTCTIAAQQAGNTAFNAAAQVSQSFTVRAIAPGAPVGVTALLSDTTASIAFAAPASNGGAAITSYTVTASSGGFTARGSTSPLVVAGLAKGSAYTFTVVATNSAGTGPSSAASNIVALPNDNPFNTGGTQTVTSLTPGSGVTPTRATADLVTNLDKLDRRVGISDNGVIVVLDNGLKEPLKFRDNPPDNLLISMPSQKPLDVQLNGNTFNVKVDPETPTPAKQTILATSTLALRDGSQVKGLELVQGEVAIGNQSGGSIIGGLELSKDGTLRDLVAQAGAAGGTVGFKKALDGSGAVSAESGEVNVWVRLRNTNTATLKMSPASSAHTLSAITTDALTITLKTGEVARFDTQGELTGIFLGSLSGKGGKTGDSIVLSSPAGVGSYPATTVMLEGGNVLGRTGTLFTTFMNSRFNDAMQFTQRADGLVRIAAGDRSFYGRAVGGLQIVPTAPDGYQLNDDNSVSITFGGIRGTYQPMLANGAEFASYLKTAHSLTADVLDNGALMLSSSTSKLLYVARPRYDALASADAKPGLVTVDPLLASMAFTSVAGTTQRIEPAFYDEQQVRQAAAMQGWALGHTGYDGSGLKVLSPAGQTYVVVPGFVVEPVTASEAAPAGSIQISGDKLYIYYKGQALRQGFTIVK